MRLSNAKTLLAIVFLMLTFTDVYSCPPVLESDLTMPGPGGSYGYVHLSYNNQLWHAGQPRRYHDRFLLLGPVSFRLPSPILFGSVGVVAFVAFFGAIWRWNNQRSS
jgi:hypothetical protein